MGAPYGRKSSSKANMRRSANMKYTAPQSVKCPNCGEPVMPHRVCLGCGHYKGKAVLEQKSTATED
jgi:large subunit ribosomal protein L32